VFPPGRQQVGDRSRVVTEQADLEGIGRDLVPIPSGNAGAPPGPERHRAGSANPVHAAGRPCPAPIPESRRISPRANGDGVKPARGNRPPRARRSGIPDSPSRAGEGGRPWRPDTRRAGRRQRLRSPHRPPARTPGAIASGRCGRPRFPGAPGRGQKRVTAAPGPRAHPPRAGPAPGIRQPVAGPGASRRRCPPGYPRPGRKCPTRGAKAVYQVPWGAMVTSAPCLNLPQPTAPMPAMPHPWFRPVPAAPDFPIAAHEF